MAMGKITEIRIMRISLIKQFYLYYQNLVYNRFGFANLT